MHPTGGDSNATTPSGSKGGLPLTMAGPKSDDKNDPIKKLYPFVDEHRTPLPRGWCTSVKDTHLGISHGYLKLTYRGLGKTHKDAAAVRTAHPIPATCGLYYYEVRIVSKGRDGYMGIGLCTKDVSMNRLPGWDRCSFGYHGDDGNFFCSSGSGAPYGPTFTTGDVIGCGYNLVDNSVFYTKNGQNLGIAFSNLPPDLYPTVGLQTPGEMVDTNFGQQPFVYNIADDILETSMNVRKEIIAHPLPVAKSEWFTTLIASYLAHQGYCATAESFNNATEQRPLNDILAMKTRQRIRKMILRGHISDAIYSVTKQYPMLLERNLQLMFMLKCRQFVEMIAGVDSEAREPSVSSSSSPHRSSGAPYQIRGRNSPRDSSTMVSSSSSSGAGGGRCRKSPRSHRLVAPLRSSVSVSDDEDTAAAHVTNGVHNGAAHEDAMDCGDTTHYTNGTCLSNGSAPDTQSASDNLPPIMRVGKCENVEKLLEFGNEVNNLCRRCQEASPKSRSLAKLRTKMEDAFSLLAYNDPWQGPTAYLLQPSEREQVAAALNSAILESQGIDTRPPLDVVTGHCQSLRQVLADNGYGAAAYMAPENTYLADNDAVPAPMTLTKSSVKPNTATVAAGTSGDR